jgi:hypothetical protein
MSTALPVEAGCSRWSASWATVVMADRTGGMANCTDNEAPFIGLV